MSNDFSLTTRAVLLICSATFSMTLFLAAGSQLYAHERATCCEDPCEWNFGTVVCGCSAPCKQDFENWQYFYSSSCNPIEDEDNCARNNCYSFDNSGPKTPCNIQCCADDSAYCIAG